MGTSEKRASAIGLSMLIIYSVFIKYVKICKKSSKKNQYIYKKYTIHFRTKLAVDILNQNRI